jgi:phosphatidylinositol-3,4,5-trisphosphate 3-phosphatase and dual-specificity protein phosphatase PTEN
MGYPCVNFEKFYRNNIIEVNKLLEIKHKGKYKLWNLCSERLGGYPHDAFEGRVVESYHFYDHEAPSWDIMIPICKSIEEWHNKDSSNVAVVHCKAGKGRTGTIISAYMLYTKMFSNADDSLKFYGEMRTKNKKGVTIPSQKRYVHYLDVSLKNKGNPPNKNLKLQLKKIIISPPPTGKEIFLKILDTNKKMIYEHPEKITYASNDKNITIKFDNGNVELIHDVKFAFVKSKKKKFFHFWFNTNFIENNYLKLEKKDIDKAYKDKKNFDENFQIEVFFETVSQEKYDDNEDDDEKKEEKIDIN